MKYLTFILLVGLTVALVCVHGAPANDKKTGTTTPVSPARKCKSVCTNDHSPVCGTVGRKDELTFVNKCVMEWYNCEHNTKYTVKVEGDCPGNRGVRLA